MTLIEIMVAMAIFSVLGMTLAMFLRQGVASWRTAESRRGVYEEAQALLGQLRDDLSSTFVAAPAVPAAGARARLVCDFDAQGRQRLALVRTIAGESRHPLASRAGSAIGADRDLDGRGDRDEALAGRLRAKGGLMEVLYAMDPGGDAVLLRGARSPLGGRASLFALENVERPARLCELTEPLSSQVLHFELRFWTQVTETWDCAAPPLTAARAGVKSGPAAVWDSTRALLPAAPGARPDEFRFFRSQGSLDDPDDDIFPERVRAIIVIAEEGPSATASALAAPLRAEERVVRLFNAGRFEGRGPFARIGGGRSAEWVRFKTVDRAANTLLLEPNGRGARGTLPRDHPAGAEVVTGRAFTTEIEVPASAEAWNP